MVSNGTNTLAECFASEIATTLAAFSESDHASRRGLEQLRFSDPGIFARAAVQVLSGTEPSPGARYLLSLLSNSDILIPPLADTNLCTREQAVSLAKAAARMNPAFVQKGEDFLIRLVGAPATADTACRLVRMMEILNEVGAKSCWTNLKHDLLSHPDALVRSKAALLLVQNTRNTAIASKLLLDPDVRVQASAVEGLWSLAPEDALPLLRAAVRCKNHRVRASAALGLYRCSDLDGVAVLLNMLEHEDPEFQISSAWAMGEARDPRFTPFLEAQYKVSPPAVKFAVARALATIRRRVRELEHLPLELKVSEAAAGPEETRAITFAIRPTRAFDPSTVKLTDVIVVEGGEPVLNYTVRVPRPRQKLLTGVVAPRIIAASDPRQPAFYACVDWCARLLRSGDSCRIDRYAAEAVAPDDHTTGTSPFPYQDSIMTPQVKNHRAFVSDGAVLRAIAETPGPRECAGTNAFSALVRSIEAMMNMGGERQIFLLLASGRPDRDPSRREMKELLENLRLYDVAVHALAEDDNAADYYREICAASPEGTFRIAEPERWADAVEMAYLNMLGRFQIAYTRPKPRMNASSPVAGTSDGTVTLCTSFGAGGAAFKLSPG